MLGNCVEYDFLHEASPNLHPSGSPGTVCAPGPAFHVLSEFPCSKLPILCLLHQLNAGGIQFIYLYTHITYLVSRLGWQSMQLFPPQKVEQRALATQPGSSLPWHLDGEVFINAGKSVKKREPFCTVGRNINWCSHYGEQYGGSLIN